MTAFLKWSRWFEGGFYEEQRSPAMFAVMAWVMAHADSAGTFGLDPATHEHIAEETSLTPEVAEETVATLEAQGFISTLRVSDTGVRVMKAEFDRRWAEPMMAMKAGERRLHDDAETVVEVR